MGRRGDIQVEQGWGWGLSFKYSPQENFRGTVGERVERTIVGWAEECGKQPHRHWLREASSDRCTESYVHLA